MVIIDFHVHLGRTIKGWIKPLEVYGIKDESMIERNEDELIKVMNENGINKAVIFPNPQLPTEYPKANDEISAAVKKYPERLIGFCRVDPRTGKMALKEIERSVSTLGLRGLKLHPIMEVFTVDHDAILKVIQHAANLNIPILIHSGSSSYDSAVRFSKLAEKVRNTTIIIGHFSSYPENVKVAKKHENLYLETSGAVCPSQIENAVETIGAERILFGSDWPYLNIKFEMVKIEMANISKRDKELIFGRNAEKILH